MASPKLPAATPLEQPARSPDLLAGITQTQDALRRRMGLASTVLTGPSGVAAQPATTGKALLGN